jgi:hypothetical protein
MKQIPVRHIGVLFLVRRRIVVIYRGQDIAERRFIRGSRRLVGPHRRDGKTDISTSIGCRPTRYKLHHSDIDVASQAADYSFDRLYLGLPLIIGAGPLLALTRPI